MPDAAVKVYTRCRLIPGDGSPAADGVAITVRGDVVESIGTAEPVGDVEHVDLAGKTVMPALINPHGHIGYWKAGETDAKNYSRENVLNHLRRLIYYGVSVFQFSTLSIQKYLPGDTSWLDDPALAETVPPAVRRAARQQLNHLPADRARRAADDYATLERSFRACVDAGVRISLSVDTGLLWQFPGYAEHRELEAMVQAGMAALAAIRAATAVPAQLLGLADRGIIAPGKRADFLVLNGDPLTDIACTRDIARVVIGGISIDRDCLRAEIEAMK